MSTTPERREYQRRFIAEKRRRQREARPPVPCESGCGVLVPQVPRRRRFCGDKCSERARNAKRPTRKTEAWRASRAERHPAMKYIHEERMEVNARGLAHLCMYCEVNPVKTPGGDICTDRECMTRWNSDYARGRRDVMRVAKARRSGVCACPCRRAFTTTSHKRRFFSIKCGRDFHRAERKRRKKVTPTQEQSPRPAILFGKGRAFLGRAYAAG